MTVCPAAIELRQHHGRKGEFIISINGQNLMKAASGCLSSKVVLITGANHGIGAGHPKR
jgi:hypothetical protein